MGFYADFTILHSVSHLDTLAMIKSWRHKGLKRFFLTGSMAGIDAAHAERLRRQLRRLDSSKDPRDMDVPGRHLHPLKGDMEGHWSIRTSANWRLTFSFRDGHAIHADYHDYH